MRKVAATVATFALALVGATAASAAITPTITEFGTGITVNSAPDGITAGPDGNLYFAEFANHAIGIITLSGAVTEVNVPTPGGGSTPTPQDLVADAGSIWFTDPKNDAIWSMTTDPSHTLNEYTTGMPASATPHDITVGPDGNLWFSERSANQIGELSPSDSTHTIHNYPSTALSGASPLGVATGPDHDVWFAENSGNAIGRIDPANPTATPTIYSSGISASADPRGIVSGPDGNLWFTEESGDAIGRISPSGSVHEFPLPPPTAPITTKSPAGIAAGSDGALWFVENEGGNVESTGGSGAVGRIAPDGTINEFSLTADTSRQTHIDDEGVTGPFYITLGPDGNMWFTEIEDTRVGRITTPPIAMTGRASNVKYASASIAGVVVDHAQPTVYHVDYGTTSAYGHSSANISAGSGIPPVAASSTLTGLTPGNTYHYRVVAINPTSPAYGADATFTTPKAKPKKLSAKASPRHAHAAPLHFKLTGKLSLPTGVTSSACTGHLKLKVTKNGHKVKTAKTHLKHSCKYRLKLVLHLAGSGKLKLKLSFPGNHQLTPVSKTITARFG